MVNSGAWQEGVGIGSDIEGGIYFSGKRSYLESYLMWWVRLL